MSQPTPAYLDADLDEAARPTFGAAADLDEHEQSDHDSTDDDDALDQDGDDELDEDSSDEPVTATSSATPARRTGTSRALVRRIAAKAETIAAAPPAHRELLATLFGVEDTTVDLTVAVMTGDRTSLAAISDLEQVAEAGPFEAGVTAQALGRARMRAVHTLLRSLGEVETASLNPSDTKAAIAIAKAAHSLSSAAREQMADVVALARKS